MTEISPPIDNHATRCAEVPALHGCKPSPPWSEYYKEAKAAFAQMSAIDKQNLSEIADSLVGGKSEETKKAICRYASTHDLLDALPSLDALLYDRLDPNHTKNRLLDLGWDLAGSGTFEGGQLKHAFLSVLRPGDKTGTLYDTNDCSS